MFINNIYISTNWLNNILISSLLSLIIGSILGLTQTRIKRLFAYSTISHLGFILLAINVNTVESIQAFMFYLIQYSLSNLGAFIILLSIGYILMNQISKNEQIKNLKDKDNSPVQLISQLRGLFNINPLLGLSLSITIFSFLGVPPLMGFFGKQMVLSASLDKGYIFMSLIGILTSVIGGVYYLVINKNIFFDEDIYKENEDRSILVKESKLLEEYEHRENKDYINNFSQDTDNKYLFNIISTKDKHINIISLSNSITIIISVIILLVITFMFLPNINLYLLNFILSELYLLI